MKISTLFIAFLILAKFTSAQFQIDCGATLAISNNKEVNYMILSTNQQGNKTTSFETYKISAAGAGIYVYPKFHISELMKHSLSVGVPISFGLTANSQSEESSFLYDLNIAADLNGGRLNKKNDENLDKLIGYFFGLGLGITNTDVGYEGGSATVPLSPQTKNIVTVDRAKGESVYDFMSGKSVGLLIHAGLTLPYKFDRENNNNMGLRLFVKPAFGKNQVTYFGASVFMSFGNYSEVTSKKKKK
ncbi:MAG TPA: hypothetical protein PLU17_00565 [Chitinophagaceae bacterium]|nr:hypothetical protein [Chitinophagaceae bacterium]